MSPVFTDNFDMLMHMKRQATSTGSNSNTSAPAPSPTAAPTSAAPTTTSEAAPTSTTQPTPTSTTTPTTSTVPTTTAAPTSQTSATSSTVATTESSTSVGTTSTTPATTSAASSTAVVATSTAVTSSLATSSTSRTSLSLGATFVPTTSNGQVFTVTAVVGGTSSASASASTKKSFFQNTGAVVGVFVVVGIVVTALLVMIITTFIRRRRASKFDKEVQEAAREAARAQAPIDDDDEYGTSYNTHSSQPMNPERPGGYAGYGAAAASSWDPYGRAAATGAGGGYEMQHRRTSTSTAPGVAGFAAGDVFARSTPADVPQGYNPNQGYGQSYAQDSYNTGYGQGYGGNQAYPAGYNNTSPPQNYAVAQPQEQAQAGRAPIQAQMMMPESQRHSYNTVAAFRSSPSYGQAHPGQQVEYGNATEANNAARGYDNNYPQGGHTRRQSEKAEYVPQQSEDPYGGYEPYDMYAEPGPSTSQAQNTNPPAYVAGPGGNAGATGDRKGGAAAGRRPSVSGRSGATRFSEDESDEDEPPRRVLKVANE